MLNNYTTIKEKSTGEIIEKKSKFIANVFPIESEEEALEKLEEVRKLHRDARHNVFVYRIANGTERASDDGEPSGTAGVPILDILRGMNLQNILVVVTRYFGGILLGTGGLLRAYSDTAKEALNKAERLEKKLKIKYNLKIIYGYYDKLMHYCRNTNIDIIDSQFLEDIQITVLINKENKEEFERKILELTDRTVKYEEAGEDYYSEKQKIL